MSFQAVNKQDLADLVAAQLRQRILDGRYAPDELLPAERELALQFGVNRTTLREAILQLEYLGLVERRQGSRCRVLDYRRTGTLNLLTHLLHDTSDEETRRELLLGITDVLAGLWTAIFTCAVDRIDHAAIDGLEALLPELVTSAPLDRRVRAARAFQDRLVDATDSAVFHLVANSTTGFFDRELDPSGVLSAQAAAGLASGERPFAAVCEALRDRDRAAGLTAIADLADQIKQALRG